jgi:anti-repressor protein
MEQLIKILGNPETEEAVSAKSLHEYLKIETRFDVWISRMIEYGFEETIDYQRMYRNVQSNIQRDLFNSILEDVAITFDMAKHLSMIQRTPEGMKARNWFIEREKKATILEQKFQIPKTYSEALMLAANQAKEIEQQNIQIKELAPKAEIFDQISDCNNLKSVGTVAKELGIGCKRLFHYMRSIKIIMPSPSTIPYQTYIDQGYFKVKTSPIPGTNKNYATAYLTAKGEI